jgi:SAM-dependent methyltransferase
MSQKSVRDYYDKECHTEWRRLVKDPFSQLEFDTTMHFLNKYMPSQGLILDAGGGPGRYTIELAKHDYEVVLFDLSSESLKKADRQIRRAKVQDKVKQLIEGCITDLSEFENNTFDSVLCLGGPLSHLLREADRDLAVNELIRVAKPRAPLFVSVIGRLVLFRDGLESFPELLELKDLFMKILDTGTYEGGHGFTAVHFFLSEEFKTQFEKKPVEILEMVGLEGLASGHQRKLNQMARKFTKRWENWQEYHLKSCTHPHIVGTSNHILLICLKS